MTGEVRGIITAQGINATSQDLHDDAVKWEASFGRDVRCLHHINHNHDCSHTCVKHQKKSEEEKKEMLKRSKAPPCRFWFFRVIVLTVWDGMKDKIRRFRRRGKPLVDTPFVHSTNERNEYGLAEVERLMPFRSASQDVKLAALRCNNDFRFMARGFPPTTHGSHQSGAEQPAVVEHELRLRCEHKELDVAIRNITFTRLDTPLLRRMAYSVVAIHVAAFNCDFYITKYQCKNMEQLQNLVTQYALGIRRLEMEENEEELQAKASGNVHKAESSAAQRKRRARRITLRLAMAANRSTWVSSTEMMIYIMTGDTHWSTHDDHPVFLARPWYMIQECRRLLHGVKHGKVLQAAHVPIATLSFGVSRLPQGLDENSSVAQAPVTSTGAAILGEQPVLSSSGVPQCAAGRSSGTQDPAAVTTSNALPTAEPGVSSGVPQLAVSEGNAAEDEEDEAQRPEEDDEHGEDSHGEDPQSAEDEKEDDAIKVELQSFRTTTTRYDDWLHRGPFLASMQMFCYMRYVRRVPKRGAAKSKKHIFYFDEHYELADHYCQQILQGVEEIPRLVCAQCPSVMENDGEQHAAFKAMLFTPVRCPGPGACADPMMYAGLFMQTHGDVAQAADGGVTQPAKARWSAKPGWKATLADLRVSARRGRCQSDEAQRLPVLFDTPLCKTWRNGNDKIRGISYIEAMCMQVLMAKHNQILSSALNMLCRHLGTTTGPHPQQLSLEDFLAIKANEMNTHLDFQNIARKKPLQIQKQQRIEDEEVEEDVLRKADKREVEFYGGGDQEEMEDEDWEHGDVQYTCRENGNFTEDECRSLLCREMEVERAGKPGRHSERDVQMQGFVRTFAEELHMTLPVPTAITGDFNKTNVSVDVAAQAGAAKDLRQKESRGSEQDVTAALDSLPLLEALQRLNELSENRRDEGTGASEECALVKVEDAWKGPAHVAAMLLKQIGTLNDEQVDIVALVVAAMQRVFDGRANPLSYQLPCDRPMIRLIIVGGGGCGKTTLIKKVLQPLFDLYFGSRGTVLQAQSNKAARVIGGKTIHSSAGLLAHSSLRTSSLSLQQGSAQQKKLEAIHVPAGAEVFDEWSQIPAALFHAHMFRIMDARRTQYKLRQSDYHTPDNICGRISVLLLAGDHLQLPPVPKTTSLLAPLEGTSQEHQAGAGMFCNIEHVYVMKTMMRFTDPILVSILEKMRVPRNAEGQGAKLSAEEWQAMVATKYSSASPPPADWYQACYLHSVVSMAAYMRARASAKASGKTLCMLLAVDTFISFERRLGDVEDLEGKRKDKIIHREALQEPNVNATGHLPAFCLFHVGMRIRLTATIPDLAPWAVLGATGEVIDYEAMPADQNLQSGALQSAPSEYKFRSLPKGVYVKLDNCKESFLQSEPCREHTQYAHGCPSCVDRRGVVVIRPLRRTFKLESHTYPNEGKIQIIRHQIPLMPEKACPIYSLQGTTTDPGMIAHFDMPRNSGEELQWLIVYVTLSRVRSLAQLRTVGLDSKIKNIIEGGAPEAVVAAFSTLLEPKHAATKAACQNARVALGWPAAAQ